MRKRLQEIVKKIKKQTKKKKIIAISISLAVGGFIVFSQSSWANNIIKAYKERIENQKPAASVGYGTQSTLAIITGPGPGYGRSPWTRGFSLYGTPQGIPDFDAYANNYYGGMRIAAGDIDSDGVDEIITGTGENGGPHLRVFEKDGTQRGIEYFAFHPLFRGGMDVASGDFDGDGKEDIAVSQFAKGECWAKIYRYNTQRTVLFYKGQIYGRVEAGCTVAMGDIDLDGRDELIVGAGTGGGPHIKTFDYDPDRQEGFEKPISFFAFHPDSRTGVDVAAGDADGDGKAEVIVSQLKNGQAWVKVYRYNSQQTVLTYFNAFGEPEVGGNVDLFDIDRDGAAEILVGAGKGGGPLVRTFETDGELVSHFFAYDSDFRGGTDVAGGTFDE